MPKIPTVTEAIALIKALDESELAVLISEWKGALANAWEQGADWALKPERPLVLMRNENPYAPDPKED